MDILNNVPVIYLTEEQIQRIKLDQRARHLEPNLSDIEAKEMWHLLHEEPEYADEILDGYEKLVRDRRIKWVIDHLPEKERYMMQRAIYTIPNWADEILDYWEGLAKNGDDEGWDDVGWDDDDD